MLKPRSPQCLVSILAIISICFFSSTAFAQYGIFDQTADWGLEPQFPPKIGNYKVPGSVVVTGTGSSAVYELKGNGESEHTESFYLYKNMFGSYSIQAKVNWIDTGGGSDWAKIGLSIREKGESTSSNHYTIAMEGSNKGDRSDVIWKDMTGGNSGAIAVWKPEGDLLKNPGTGLWFRLSRITPQDLYTYEYSLNGTDWVLINQQTLKFSSAPVSYGLFINNALDNDKLAIGSFTNVSLSPAFTGTRTIGQETIQPGEKAPVSIAVFNPNETAIPVSVSEQVPIGLSVSDINNNGALSSNTITWNFSASPGTTSLTYKIAPVLSTLGSLTWNGNVNTFPIGGQNSVYIYKSSAVSDPNFTSLAEIIPSEHPNHKDGSAIYDAGTNTYTIAGNGNDIWDTNDELMYLYKSVTGSWQAEATVEWDTVTNDWARIGLMCRKTVDPHSPQIGVFYRGLKDLIQMAVRPTFQSSTQETSSTLPSNLQGTPARIRLSRFTNEGMFLGEWYDSNQNAWIPVWRMRVDLPDEVLLGLAITSHIDDDSSLASGKVKDFTFTPIPFTIRRNTAKQVVSKQDTLPVEVVVEIDSKNPSNLKAIETIPPNAQVTGISASTGSASVNGNGELVWTASNATGRQFLRYTLNVNWPETGGMYLKGTANNGSGFQTDIQDNLIIVSDLETEDEFNGPFSNWMDLKRDLGAKGDGVADDTQAFQKAFDRLKADNNEADRVLYIPAGTYRITQSLKLLGVSHFEALGFEIVGEDPATTTILWDGSLGDPMIRFSAWNCKVSRLTLDGNGKAETGILWGPRFSIFSELSDMIFRDLSVGVQGGIYENNGIDSVTTLRCSFIRCSKAGISIENYNSLNWFVWNSVFEFCGRAVTNSFGAGTFHVYNCMLYKSTISDFSTGVPDNMSFRGNTSIQSKAFYTTSGGNSMLVIENNKIYNPLSLPINANGGTSLSLYDNIIRYNQSPAVLISNLGTSLLATGNIFTTENPINANNDAVIFENSIVSDSNIAIEYPNLPKTPKFIKRPVIEVPTDAEDEEIQEAINQADTLRGQRAIVHFRPGIYYIKNTLIIPQNSDIQLHGEGTYRTSFCWRGQNYGVVMKVNGPSQILIRDLEIYGPMNYQDENNRLDGNGIIIDNCDQVDSRIYFDQCFFTDGNATNTGTALFTNKMVNADISLYNTQFYNQSMDITVIGNGDLEASRNAKGRIVLFSGVNTTTTDGCYDVRNGGRLVVKDTRYEQHMPEYKQFLLGDGDIDFGLECSNINPIDPYTFTSSFTIDTPAVELKNFGGNVSLLINFFNYTLYAKYDPAPITISNGKANSNVMIFGCSFNQEGNVIHTSSSSTTTSVVESRAITNSGDIKIPKTNNTGTDFINDMLALTREERPIPLAVMNKEGVTDIQLHRVVLSEFKKVLQINHDVVDLNLPTYDNLGIFEKAVDWRRYGNYKTAGTVEIQENNGDPIYTIGGNGDGVGKRDVGAPNDVDDAFYVYKELTGNWSIQAKFEWIDTAKGNLEHAWPQIYLMIREKGNRTTSPFCSISYPWPDVTDIWCYARTSYTGRNDSLGGFRKTSWLRLSRINQNTFLYESSSDGTTWNPLCTCTNEMSETVSYGIAIANGYDNNLLAKAKISNVKIIPTEDTIPPTPTPFAGGGIFDKFADWSKRGTYKVPGTIQYDENDGNPIYTISGNGDDIWDDRDEGFYLFKNLSGNWSLEGRFEWIDSGGGSDWAKVGVMIRDEGDQILSKHCFLAYTNTQGTNFHWREQVGGSTQNFSDSKKWIWLRISRIDKNNFKSEISSDGITWIAYRTQTMDMGDTVSYGIAITNHNDNNLLAIAKVTNLKLMPYEDTLLPISTPTKIPTPTFTYTPKLVPTNTNTSKPTVISTPTVKSTPTNTPTFTRTSTLTNTPTPSHTPTLTPSPTPIPFLTRWEFNTDNEMEGWQGSGIANLAVSGGAFTGAAETNDPLIQKMGINVQTRYISGIAIRFRASQASALQVFIATLNGEWKFQYIQDLPYTGDNEFQTYIIPLALNGAENQVLDLLRIDPAVDPGVQFEIDWIGLISSGVLQPTPTFTPIPAPTPTYSPTPKPVGIPGWEIY